MPAVEDTGIIYRNRKPHLRSRHAYFPSVADLGNGELVCSMMVGEAFESVDGRLHLARSLDGGHSWTIEGRMIPEDTGVTYSETGRIALMRDGSLVANVCKADRRRAEEGYTNPDRHHGFVETEFHLYRSVDKGKTWVGPETIAPAFDGFPMELCHHVLALESGKWLLPASSWRTWDGEAPAEGIKAFALVSRDEGRTWPEYVATLDDHEKGIIYFESKVAEMRPGHLVAVAWAYDEPAGTDLPIAYTLSEDGGSSFSRPRSTDLCGQTPSLIPLGEDRLLCVYRRTDIPGLWAAEVSLKDREWKTERQTALWGCPDIYTGDHNGDMSSKFSVLRFGAPCITRLDDGAFFTAFWCVEDCVGTIRWTRLRTDER